MILTGKRTCIGNVWNFRAAEQCLVGSTIDRAALCRPDYAGKQIDREKLIVKQF